MSDHRHAWMTLLVCCGCFLIIRNATVLVAAESRPENASTAAGQDSPVELLRAAEHDFARGGYQDGLSTATRALSLAEEAGAPLETAAALLVRANLFLALTEIDSAITDLERALELPLKARSPSLELAVRLNLGNARLAQGNFAAARSAYQDVYVEALGFGDSELAARAAVNAIRVDADSATPLQHAQVTEVRGLIEALSDSPSKALLLVHLGVSHRRGAESGVGNRMELIPTGNALLRAALSVADKMSARDASPRIRAQALGHLAGFYALEGRLEEALKLTGRALRQTSLGEVPGELFAWHQQAAQLHQERGDRQRAIEAYEAALGVLEANRGAISRALTVAYGKERSVSELNSLYRNYVDLLLRRAREQGNAADRTRDLTRAQATLEQLKGDELRDYFEDDCVTRYQEKVTSVQSAAKNAVVIYPFVLEDRLELLVSVGDELEQIVVDVSRSDLHKAVKQLRIRIEDRTSRAYLRPSRQLYNWLVRPIEKILDRADPKTLVFIPDGVLRTIPMAVLHDGERFLIERIALGLTPGLELTDPTPLPEKNRLSLVAGLSEAVGDFVALPSVEREVTELHQILGGDRLLDEFFSQRALTDHIQAKNFRLIHIASHAQFESSAAGGFLLTHDGKMSFDALSDALASTLHRDDPLDLIVLSACETADGGARAALGLSGVAVKAGARSALGTLWRVDDEATSDFMIRFHTALAEPQTSRARAVQIAQQALMNDPRFAHPYYWSAFLLINSWL